MTNSLIAVAINLIGMLVIYSLMAFALVRLSWHGRGMIAVLLTIIAAGQFWIVPPFVPNLKDLDPAAYLLWFGNWVVSGFSVVILCQGVRRIPRNLEDSARLDGCGWFGTYRHVVLPLVRRELALIAFLTAMATSPVFWVAEVVFTTPGRVFPPWFYLLFPMREGPTFTSILLMIMAGSLVMTLPVILIFVFAKRLFLQDNELAE
jgi:ABC-type glycerol-3-phosphate transport system permease component